MVKVFPKSANQPKEIALTIRNSISRNCLRLMRHFERLKTGSNISKTSASVSSGFKHEKTDESTRPQAECFYCFRVFETPMKHEARVFEITSPTKEN